MYKRLHIKGHKLHRDWRGAQGGFAYGRCECGNWEKGGFVTRMRDVVHAHNDHLERVRDGQCEYHQHSKVKQVYVGRLRKDGTYERAEPLPYCSQVYYPRLLEDK